MHSKMNRTAQAISTRAREQGRRTIGVSDGFWFTAAFLLFLLAGPFAAPVVLLALYQLAGTAPGTRTPLPSKA